jgi:hypothetical protein
LACEGAPKEPNGSFSQEKRLNFLFVPLVPLMNNLGNNLCPIDVAQCALNLRVVKCFFSVTITLSRQRFSTIVGTTRFEASWLLDKLYKTVLNLLHIFLSSFFRCRRAKLSLKFFFLPPRFFAAWIDADYIVWSGIARIGSKKKAVISLKR